LSKAEVAYYPGCSALTTERPYLKTAEAVLKRLGVPYRLLEDAPCCGTVELEMVDREASRRVSEIVAEAAGGATLVTGCSGCYGTLRRGGVEVRHLVEFLGRDIGAEEIAKRAIRGWPVKVAPYYGCQALRPREQAIDDPEDPQILEELLAAIGAEPVNFRMRLKCCGGPIFLRRPERARQLAKSVLESASFAGAECVVTICNLCHFMLDFYGGGTLPVLHVTQPIAYALGEPMESLGLEDHFTPVHRRLFQPRP